MINSNFAHFDDSEDKNEFDITAGRKKSDYHSYNNNEQFSTEQNNYAQASVRQYKWQNHLKSNSSESASLNVPTSVEREGSKEQQSEKILGKKSAYGSKVSYVTRFFDEDINGEKNDFRTSNVENEKVYLPRFCVSSIYPKSGASLVYAGLLAAFRIYFREKASKEKLQLQNSTSVSPFVLSPFVKNNRFIKFVSAKRQVEIDSWLLDKETLSWFLCKNSADSKLAIIDSDKCMFETALYGQAQKLDEGSGRSPALASADHFARQANCPLILILDASQSIAQLVPIIKGQMSYARPTLISALVLNKVDERNYTEYKEFLERELNLPVIGYLPYDSNFNCLEEDYYELKNEDRYAYSLRVQKLAEVILKNLDLDLLYSIAKKASTLNSYISQALFQVQKKLGSEKIDINIAYAKDEAFDNSSLENLYLLSELGVNLIPLSPLLDDELREDIDGLYLSSNNIIPFRKALSDNRKFNKSVQYAAKRGLPIFAEEEAYLYICSGFSLNYENVFWPMCSISSMRLDIDQGIDREEYEYISMTNAVNNPIASLHWTIKSVIKSYLLEADSGNATKVRRERNRQTCHLAYANSNVFATASKLSFVAEPRTLLRFVSACLNYRDEKFSTFEAESDYKSSYAEEREVGVRTLSNIKNLSTTIPYDVVSSSNFDNRKE